MESIPTKVATWLKALRLQFYPMVWAAYTVGAFGADTFAPTAYWAGYACVFLVEVATVLTNEYFDVESDRRNDHHSSFSGGSRVLVDQALSRREVLGGAAVALVGVGVAAGVLIGTSPAPTTTILILLIALGMLALGYTMPPLELSHRGLGELEVGLLHSAGVVLCGYVFQGGAWHDAFPWLVSVPLFLSVLPSILLAGLPDVAADRAAGKETLVVKIGPRRALMLAMVFTLMSALAGVTWHLAGLAGGAYSALIYLALPHAAALLILLYRRWKLYDGPERIDRLIAVSLAYVLWFSLVPLVALW